MEQALLHSSYQEHLGYLETFYSRRRRRKKKQQNNSCDFCCNCIKSVNSSGEIGIFEFYNSSIYIYIFFNFSHYYFTILLNFLVSSYTSFSWLIPRYLISLIYCKQHFFKCLFICFFLKHGDAIVCLFQEILTGVKIAEIPYSHNLSACIIM